MNGARTVITRITGVMAPPLVVVIVAISTAVGGPAAQARTAHPARLWSGADPGGEFTIDFDQESLALRLGERFRVTSTIRNNGRPSAAVVAHLNVLSLDRDVYVDPEDWSADRTRYLGSLPADSSTPLIWNGQAVNSGPILLYVTVTEPDSTDAVISSPALRLEVAPQPPFSGRGALPLALGVPAALLALGVLVVMRRQRRLRPTSQGG